MKQIEWTKRALRQLRKIADQRMRETIVDAVATLKQFPDCANIKKLTARNQYRLRVARYRVIFTEQLTVLYIEEVLKRNERTYA